MVTRHAETNLTRRSPSIQLRQRVPVIGRSRDKVCACAAFNWIVGICVPHGREFRRAEAKSQPS